MRLNFAGHRPFAMAVGNCLCRAFRSELKQAGVARLDFVAQRRSEAMGGRDVAYRSRATHLLACLDPDVGESCAAQLLTDQRDIVIAVRRAGEESWRVVRVGLSPFDPAIAPGLVAA